MPDTLGGVKVNTARLVCYMIRAHTLLLWATEACYDTVIGDTNGWSIFNQKRGNQQLLAHFVQSFNDIRREADYHSIHLKENLTGLERSCMAMIRLATGMEKWMGICLTAVLLLILLAPAGVCGADNPFGNLAERLIADGVDANLVKSIYQDPKAQVELEVVAGNLVRSEATLDYGQFLSSYSVNKAARYLKRYRQTLERAKKRFGVEPEVVVAVLMVETALGTYSGKYLAVNVLSTMAASEEGEIREKVFASLSEEQRNMQSPEVISQRLTTRAARGYRELKALIAYFKNNEIEPFSVRGSSEGAIGIPQFLPSNIEYYGRDGDGDGRIDLFNHNDAIFSVACFLRAHRWEKARNNREKKNVLLYYNRSTYYADTVYTLAQKLNGKKPL